MPLLHACAALRPSKSTPGGLLQALLGLIACISNPQGARRFIRKERPEIEAGNPGRRRRQGEISKRSDRLEGGLPAKETSIS
jgi:hypothetical protein